MSAVVTVTVSGPTGSGKSGIAAEIEVALKALGYTVEFLHAMDEIAAHDEMHAVATGGYTTLNEHRRIVIAERNEPIGGRSP